MIVRFELGALKQAKWYEYASRFLFGGAVTVLTGLIAKKYGPVIGGLFLAFPAIFPATATLIEKHEREKKERAGLRGTKRARVAVGVDGAGAAIGSIGLVAFAAVTWQLVPRTATWLTLTIAVLAWFGVSVAVWFARKRYWLVRTRIVNRHTSRHQFVK
jgi:hypothetical protein